MTSTRFELDPTGFPLIWVDAVGAFMHWLPVTKVQFECFLCAAPDSHFDARWYDAVLELNPRTSAADLRNNNYWQAFLTGISPAEAQRFANWCGGAYSVPSLEEWFQAYKALKAEAPLDDPVVVMASLNLKERTRALVARLDTIGMAVTRDVAGSERTLADQMLMRLGVMEWVECNNQRSRWGGMGETHPKFRGALQTPDHGQPMIPINPETNRLGYFGLRLLWRPE